MFSSSEFCSTQPRTFSVPDHDHSASPRPFSIQFASRVVQKSSLSSDISRENCSALVRAPSTFHALHTSPNDEYFESENARTTPLALRKLSRRRTFSRRRRTCLIAARPLPRAFRKLFEVSTTFSDPTWVYIDYRAALSFGHVSFRY